MSLDSHVYYFDIGEGRWAGSFGFSIEDRAKFRTARLAPWDRVLAHALGVVQRLPGEAEMRAEILCDPEEGEAGVARVEVSVKRFGLEIYQLRGHYGLRANGADVAIEIEERFGPVGMPWRTKRATAKITEAGLRATYTMPILGEDFVGVYDLDADRTFLDAKYHSAWGLSSETMRRQVPSCPTDGIRRARWDAVLDMARELERRMRAFDRARDARATFTHVYAYFLRDLAYALDTVGFDDPDWVVRLGKAFAQQLLEFPVPVPKALAEQL